MTVNSADSEHEDNGMAANALAHVDAAGRARMVDVTGKPWTRRRALARCQLVTPKSGKHNGCLANQFDVALGTSDTWDGVFLAARLAGIHAAKQTARVIPLCHPLNVSGVEIRLSLGTDAIQVESEAQTTGPTGVEMEALLSCAVAALSVMGALRTFNPELSIEDLTLWEKSGGRSGAWVRMEASESISESGNVDWGNKTY